MKNTKTNMSTVISMANEKREQKRRQYGDQQKMLECFRRIKGGNDEALWDLYDAISDSGKGETKQRLGFSCGYINGAIDKTLEKMHIDKRADLKLAAINRTLEVVWNSASTVEEEEKFGSWLYTVAVNAAKETARQEKMLSFSGAPWLVLESDLPLSDKDMPSPMTMIVDRQMTPEESCRVNSVAELVSREMKKRCSNAVYHAYHFAIELEYSPKETAKILNISEETAYKRIQCARKHLADLRKDQ